MYSNGQILGLDINKSGGHFVVFQKQIRKKLELVKHPVKVLYLTAATPFRFNFLYYWSKKTAKNNHNKIICGHFFLFND